MFITGSKPGTSIEWFEWGWVVLASAIIILLSSAPYIAGYLNQTGRGVFVGAVYDRSDYAAHLSAMRIGWSGEWQFRLRFTAEPNPGVYAKLAYIFLGHLAQFFKISLIGMYHIARIVFGFASCLLIYAISAWCFREVLWRRVAFLLAALASGLGWLQMVAGWVPSPSISPIDFWLSDAYYFFGLMVFPHFSAITMLTLAILLCGIAFLYRPRWFFIAIMSACILALQSFQPYAPVFADIALLGIFLSWWLQVGRIQWSVWMGMGIYAVVQIPLLAYNAWVFASSPVWQGFVAQNITASPPLVYLIWGFGILLPLAIAGLIVALRSLFSGQEKPVAEKFTPFWGFFLWSLGCGLLTYSPTVLQRRFLHAMTIPLAIMATEGLRSVIFPWIDSMSAGRLKRWYGHLALLLVGFASISSVLLSFGGVAQVLMFPEKFYVPDSVVQAVDWSGSNAPARSVVLAAPETSFALLERTDLTAYLGHPIETLQYDQKVNLAREFFCNNLHLDRMESANVILIISGPYESQFMGCDPDFPRSSLVYSRNEVRIFRMP